MKKLEPNIQIIGVRNIPQEARRHIERLVYQQTEKISERLSPAPVSTALHFKRYSSPGRRHKFSVHARAFSPSLAPAYVSSDGWEILDTTQKVLKKLWHQCSLS